MLTSQCSTHERFFRADDSHMLKTVCASV